MSSKCIGESAPNYKKVKNNRVQFDGTPIEEIIYIEDGMICLGCFKVPCQEDTKKGWTLINE